jgi:RNA polymerase sigma-70 factor, ECF subfamily
VAGLTTREIAAAFLLPEPTLAQRLVRAKRKIREAGIRFDVPGPDALTERLAGVRAVVYLVFNEGYAATGGDELVRAELCEEGSGSPGCCTGCCPPMRKPADCSP